MAAGESLPRPRVLLLLPAALVGLTAHPAPLYTVAQGVGDVQGNGMGWLCDLLLGPEGSGLPTQHNSDPSCKVTECGDSFLVLFLFFL